MLTETAPELIWFNGRIVPWREATVHVWSELAIRGANVFEGIRAYWHGGECVYYVLSLDEHLKRLFESAKLLRFPSPSSTSELRSAIAGLLEALDLREHAYVRPTLYIDSGRYGYRPESVSMGAYVVAFPVPRPDATRKGARCCISTWRRASDLSLSPRIKAGAAYQGFRLPRIEAAERGLDDVILLNSRDTVAEASGAAVFVVRDGRVATPPLSAGILESITRRKAIDLLAAEFGQPTAEREIERTELYVADEVFLCGTLSEIQPVVELDGLAIGNGAPGPLTCRLRDRYIAICEGGPAAPAGWLTRI